jgi:hypothetical protein
MNTNTSSRKQSIIPAVLLVLTIAGLGAVILLRGRGRGLPEDDGKNPASAIHPEGRQEPPSLEAAFGRIYVGMPQDELDKLMAPFERVNTGHGQWPIWTDGEWRVGLTLDISKFLMEDRPIRVIEGVLRRKQFDGKELKWAVIKQLPER